MSIFLYRLGGAIARARGLVLGVWLLVLAAVVGGSVMLGPNYDDSFSIPGTQSQQGQDVLAERFGLTGTNGQILYTSAAGPISAGPQASAVGAAVKKVDALSGVTVSNPLAADAPLISQDKRSTIAQVRFASKVPSDATLDAVLEAAKTPASSGVTASVGGDAYKSTADPSKVPELLGLLVSFMILAVTFGSLIAAGMPILTSLVGVGITLSAVVVTTSLVTVSSSAPTLAEMLGLAVGIDYALFLLSRHRTNLGSGVSPQEAMSRAMATAGSAVVFAGATVVIALLGLAVARIPVLTVMGLAAAAAVSVAVLVALTLVPAIALLLGERLRPRVRTPRRRPWRRTPSGTGPGAVWIRVITRYPVVTVLIVLGLLTLAATPASGLKLALPDNSTAPAASTQRLTYDAITKAFGEGYNAPLSITASVITSSDPKTTVSDLSAAVAAVPDVVAVTEATPNPAADTALLVIIPSAGQTSPSTKALVRDLRERTPGWEKKYGTSPMFVTGQTAVNIDVSDRLADALLPFAAIVIGLSLLLLMVVFRSIAVPLKATLGYLLSVGAALGAVVAVFQWGWLDSSLGLSAGPIVSFLPIFVMGVLFGLAMDYEMFLVSAMREEYVRSGDARQAVLRGFRASSKVVTAAALIMTSVFVAFIPNGSATIQPIALGLAVGVFVDAFIVRMTLVPAVLMMLGRWAWWLPRWLERSLPEVDVEGAALHRKLEFGEWEDGHGATSLLARDLVVHAGGAPVQLAASPGRITRLRVPAGSDHREIGHVLAGRERPVSGELVVAGLLLPEQREAVNRAATLIDLGRPGDASDAEQQVRDRARLVSFSARQRRDYVARTLALVAELDDALGLGTAADLSRPDRESTFARAALSAAVVEASLALACGTEVVVLVGFEDLNDAGDRGRAELLAEGLAQRGVAVVVLHAPHTSSQRIEVVA